MPVYSRSLKINKLCNSWHYLKPNLTNQTRRVDHIAAAKLKLFKDSNQPQQRVVVV